mmetsp:Transcript_21361/g.50574  ORF Transcript_21361/g.50574 Transcript_21361/m.50574 type:complete len:392 (+) Transcript_21361:180-1355(+)
MHMDTTPKRCFVRCSSLRSVAICRAPVHPSGCPRAIAPPFGLTRAGSMLRTSMHQLACDAKASLISQTSMSPMDRPHCFNTAGMATAGPIPMTRGGTPLTAYPLQIPRTGNPRFWASARVVTNTAAAPSVVWDELPAVVLPSSEKTGLSLDRIGRVVRGRMPSSSLTSPTGTISLQNLPAARAAAAFWWDSAANSSRCSRFNPYCDTMLSLVTPMGMRQSMTRVVGWARFMAFQSTSGALMDDMGVVDMDSTPPPMPMAILPEATLSATQATAWSPELHCRLIQASGVVSASMPATTWAMRMAAYPDGGSRQLPRTRSSMSSPLTPVRFRVASRTVLSSVEGGVLARAPLRDRHSGVRRAETMTTSLGSLVVVGESFPVAGLMLFSVVVLL